MEKLKLIGDHPTMHAIDALIGKVAATDATVLITGESGTGKEVVARAIHARSARADRPFTALNCGAIPGDLLESELFGHERGAVTGALTARAGAFQTANRGTLLLDEIGELSPAAQVKLLRVLQDRQIRPVGSDRLVRTDVRVIAATNRHLRTLVERGAFREDLYYRLDVVTVALPRLRERRSDVPLLAAEFLRRANARRAAADVALDDAAMELLWEYDWPGNVRELENVIERVVALAEGPIIRAADLPADLRVLPMRRLTPQAVLTDAFDLTKAVADFENGLIHEALRRAKGNRQAAARLLGLGRTTLVAKMARQPHVFARV